MRYESWKLSLWFMFGYCFLHVSPNWPYIGEIARSCQAAASPHDRSEEEAKIKKPRWMACWGLQLPKQGPTSANARGLQLWQGGGPFSNIDETEHVQSCPIDPNCLVYIKKIINIYSQTTNVCQDRVEKGINMYIYIFISCIYNQNLTIYRIYMYILLSLCRRNSRVGWRLSSPRKAAWRSLLTRSGCLRRRCGMTTIGVRAMAALNQVGLTLVFQPNLKRMPILGLEF